MKFYVFLRIEFLLKKEKNTICSELIAKKILNKLIGKEIVMVKFFAKLLRIKKRRTPDAPVIWLYPDAFKRQ